MHRLHHSFTRTPCPHVDVEVISVAYKRVAAFLQFTIHLVQDFSLRRGRRHPFRCKARSPQIRALAFPARPPRLRHRTLVTKASRLLARSPSRCRLVRGSCSSARSFAPRFLHAALAARRSAVRFGRCDQLPEGLPPSSQCPCWAYKTNGDGRCRPRGHERQDKISAAPKDSCGTTPRCAGVRSQNRPAARSPARCGPARCPPSSAGRHLGAPGRSAAASAHPRERRSG